MKLTNFFAVALALVVLTGCDGSLPSLITTTTTTTTLPAPTTTTTTPETTTTTLPTTPATKLSVDPILLGYTGALVKHEVLRGEDIATTSLEYIVPDGSEILSLNSERLPMCKEVNGVETLTIKDLTDNTSTSTKVLCTNVPLPLDFTPTEQTQVATSGVTTAHQLLHVVGSLVLTDTMATSLHSTDYYTVTIGKDTDSNGIDNIGSDDVISCKPDKMQILPVNVSIDIAKLAKDLSITVPHDKLEMNLTIPFMCDTDTNGTLHVSVRDEHGQQVPIHDAAVEVYQTGQREIVGTGITNSNGETTFELPHGSYLVRVKAWGRTYDYGKSVEIAANGRESIGFNIPLGFQIKATRIENGKPIPCDTLTADDIVDMVKFEASYDARISIRCDIFKAGDIVEFSASYDPNIQIKKCVWALSGGDIISGQGAPTMTARVSGDLSTVSVTCNISG